MTTEEKLHLESEFNSWRGHPYTARLVEWLKFHRDDSVKAAQSVRDLQVSRDYIMTSKGIQEVIDNISKPFSVGINSNNIIK